VVVKAVAGRFAAERAAWAAAALPVLAGRGYPVPAITWHGSLDGTWYLTIQPSLPGRPLAGLGTEELGQLLALTGLQADPQPAPAGWDVSWWISAVLFDGWEQWWDTTLAVAPGATRRLRLFLEPAWGHRMAGGDIVHHDFSLGNILARGGSITGVVDWDDAGSGSRAVDLAALLFEWHRLRLGGMPAAPCGGELLTRSIIAIAGDEGLRCVIAYEAIASLALAARRGDVTGTRTWRRVTGAVLDMVTGMPAQACSRRVDRGGNGEAGE
jgi:Phosphotransferase enzyme family